MCEQACILEPLACSRLYQAGAKGQAATISLRKNPQGDKPSKEKDDDVSDQFVLINLKGEKVFDLLSTGCPLNFGSFKTKKGPVAQTLLAQVDIIIHHRELNDVNLFVRRSFSEHLVSWINDAASRL